MLVFLRLVLMYFVGAFMENSTREFIRKWGTNIITNEVLHPVIKHKYNVAFVIKNSNKKLLKLLEPWADYISVDFDAEDYVIKENKKTLYNMYNRVGSWNNDDTIKNHNIVIKFDGSQLKTQEQFNQITIGLSDIITSVNDGEDIGNGVEFEWDIFHMLVKSFKTYEMNNVVNKLKREDNNE